MCKDLCFFDKVYFSIPIFFCFERFLCDLSYLMSWKIWYVIVLPSFLLLSFVLFICISCLFMTYRGIHLDLEQRKDNKRDKWKKEMETKECLQSGEDITAKKESIWKSEKECWTDEKIRMKGRKKKTKTSEKKSEMWAIHKQTSPRDLRPAHLLLFTSEEIDTLWKRGSWPRDKTAAAPN